MFGNQQMRGILIWVLWLKFGEAAEICFKKEIHLNPNFTPFRTANFQKKTLTQKKDASSNPCKI